MNRKIIVLMLMLVALLPLVPEILIGRAAWSEGDGYNLASWDSYTASEWTSFDDADVCYFNYTQDINNFKSWNFTVNLDDYHLTGYWYLSNIKQEVWIRIQNRNNASQYIQGFYTHIVHLSHFGWINIYTAWSFPASQMGFSSDKAFPIDVKMQKFTNTLMGMEIGVLREGLLPYNQHDTYTVSNGFFNNVTISMWVWKRLELGAVGYIHGSKTGETIGSGSAIGSSSWTTGTIDFKVSVLPSIFSIVTPVTIFCMLSITFAKAGEKIGDHPVAGFIIGGALALFIMANSAIIPVWFLAIICMVGLVGLYLWW